ncbi:ArsR/SmtB family transcription factor [Yoonia rosea]|uniref:ArsR/SmtB family transcription factor n=1 Tax=Yoonia rosea TaxID=287098 RepID=UPI0026BEAB2D|nr:winged helix-turn-helix domain-containing protein [Yoonia rosea]
MKEGPDIARIAALIGDPARANMLTALMTGKALTATELAAEAGVTLQTASGHLAKLLDGQLVQVRKQGRHKYFALAHADVGAALEALMGLAAGQGALPRGPARRMRNCGRRGSATTIWQGRRVCKCFRACWRAVFCVKTGRRSG